MCSSDLITVEKVKPINVFNRFSSSNSLIEKISSFFVPAQENIIEKAKEELSKELLEKIIKKTVWKIISIFFNLFKNENDMNVVFNFEPLFYEIKTSSVHQIEGRITCNIAKIKLNEMAEKEKVIRDKILEVKKKLKDNRIKYLKQRNLIIKINF